MRQDYYTPHFSQEKALTQKKGAVQSHIAKSWQSQDVSPSLFPDLNQGC